MFTPRLSPSSFHRVSQRSAAKTLSRDEEQTERSITLSSTKRKAPASATVSYAGQSQRRMSGGEGDLHVLRSRVDKERSVVIDARSALACHLDRLGEHHVRQKEYDDAMDAFTEALHEKRSIMSMMLPSCSSLSGSLSSALCNDPMEVASDQQDKAIDDIIHTLRNIGNVHSLRGEQDEAMRYFTEVTNLRASKSASIVDSNEDTSTLFSGLGGDGGEDTSTLMSEINEDVKALDDMFRSISFRTGSLWPSTNTKGLPLRCASDNLVSPSNKKGKSDSFGNFANLESEPFRRSSSLGNATGSSGNELTEALDMYKSVLESYIGANLEQHKETFNSLALRVDLLSENIKRPEDSANGNNATSPLSSASSSGHAADLDLALDIYQQVWTAQEEMVSAIESDCDQQLCASMASTMIRMGSLYYKLGNRVEELRMYKEAKGIYKRAFGENHAFVAGARKNIGMVLAERGEYDQAMEQFEKARRIYMVVKDGDEMNRDVASAISCMGNVKNRLGELDDALKQYMDALRIYRLAMEKADSTENKSLATRGVTSTLKVVGMVHAKKGDYDAAMGFFQEAMTLLRSSGIDSTPTGRETTASVLTRMGGIYVKKGDLDRAMEHYREAYDLTVSNRGTTNHQEAAGILHYIGGIFHKRSDYDEAMNCYQDAIRIYHSTLGPVNPTVAGTLVMVGSIHYKRRNLDSAMMFYREALRLNRNAYGLHHPDVAPILKSIGTILTKKGEYKQAYDVFRDVLSIKCTIHGTGHPEVASAYKSLGNVHYKLGELADAERQYRHALSIYRRTRGEDHPDTIAARTTIEHIRYWMKERGNRKDEERHSRSSVRSRPADDERSC